MSPFKVSPENYPRTFLQFACSFLKILFGKSRYFLLQFIIYSEISTKFKKGQKQILCHY